MKRRSIKENISKEGTVAYNIKYDLVHTNLTKKEIANKNDVPLDMVFTVLKKHKHEIDAEKKKLEEESVANQVHIIEEPEISEEATHDDQTQEINEEEHYQREGRWQLTDNDILKILELTEAGYSIRKISSIMKTSYGTIVKYQKEYGVYEPVKSYSYTVEIVGKEKKVTSNPILKEKLESKEDTKKEVVEQEKEENKKDDTPKITVISEDDNVFKAGMVKDRHIIPCNTFIFESFKDFELFDFDKMNETVGEFLDSNIKLIENEKGELVGSKALHVYVTGLTSALASIIKMCYERKINLTLLHYDHSKGIYQKQVIWDEFINERNEKQIFNNNGTLTFYNCDFESIKKNNFYMVTIVEFKSRRQQQDKVENIVVFDDYSFVWPYYGNLITEIMNNNKKKIGIFADLCSINNGTLNRIKRLSANSNFNFNYNELK